MITSDCPLARVGDTLAISLDQVMYPATVIAGVWEKSSLELADKRGIESSAAARATNTCSAPKARSPLEAPSAACCTKMQRCGLWFTDQIVRHMEGRDMRDQSGYRVDDEWDDP